MLREKKLPLYVVAEDIDGGGGGSAVMTDVTKKIYDSDQAHNFRNSLMSYSRKIDASITAIFNIVDGIGTTEAWSGPVYDAFKTKCYSFKPNLDTYATLIYAFAKQVEEIQDNFSALEEVIKTRSAGE